MLYHQPGLDEGDFTLRFSARVDGAYVLLSESSSWSALTKPGNHNAYSDSEIAMDLFATVNDGNITAVRLELILREDLLAHTEHKLVRLKQAAIYSHGCVRYSLSLSLSAHCSLLTQG